jgi:hypothetical protein
MGCFQNRDQEQGKNHFQIKRKKLIRDFLNYSKKGKAGNYEEFSFILIKM